MHLINRKTNFDSQEDKLIYKDGILIRLWCAAVIIAIVIFIIAKCFEIITFDIGFMITGLSILVTPGLATLNKREEMLLQKKLDNM